MVARTPAGCSVELGENYRGKAGAWCTRALVRRTRWRSRADAAIKGRRSSQAPVVQSNARAGPVGLRRALSRHALRREGCEPSAEHDQSPAEPRRKLETENSGGHERHCDPVSACPSQAPSITVSSDVSRAGLSRLCHAPTVAHSVAPSHGWGGATVTFPSPTLASLRRDSLVRSDRRRASGRQLAADGTGGAYRLRRRSGHENDRLA